MVDQTLSQSLRTLRRWAWLLVLLPVIAFAVAYLFTREMRKPDYRATSLVVIGSVDPTRTFEDIRAVQSLTPTYSNLLSSEAGLRPVAQSLQMPDGSNYLRKLSKKIQVTAIPDTQLVQIQATQHTRKGAIALGNALSQRLIELAAVSGNTQADTTQTRAELDDLNARITQGNSELDSLMSQFPKEGLPSLEVMLGNIRLWQDELDDLDANQTTMSELQSQILRDQTELSALQTSDPYSSRVPLLQANIAGNSATLASMQAQANQNGATDRIALLHQRINDAETAVASQSSATPAVLSPEAAATVQNLQERISVLQGNIRIWRSSAQDLESSIARMDSGSAAVFQDANSVEKLANSPIMTGILAAVLGFLVALFLAFFFDSLNTKIDSNNDVEGLGQRPLGRIPGEGMSAMFTNADEQNGELLLNFRWLLKRIRELEQAGSDGILAVSALTEKSRESAAVALGLALAAASDGRRVILIDTDWRDPRLSNQLGLDPDRGLSALDVRNFDEAATDENLLSTRMAGIFALGVGPHPARMPQILSSAELRNVIEYLSETADLLILHTGLLGRDIEAAAVASMANGTVLVGRPGLSLASELNTASAQLQSADAHLLGVVLAKSDRVRSFPWKQASRVRSATRRVLPWSHRVKGSALGGPSPLLRESPGPRPS
jgi:Mrp family chromosome partitioning ATPase/capsular polysaccharide biosynthesis protein